MQSLASPPTSFSGIVPMSDDIYLFCFFWLGFMIFRTEAFRSYLWGDRAKKLSADVRRLIPYSEMRDDFANRRFELVLDNWANLDKHTPEALSLVASSLLALGRPDDMGIFIAKTCQTLPHLRPGLQQVVAAVAAPACDVRRQHVLCALRDLHENAQDVMGKAAVQELLLAFAKHSDEDRVADLLASLSDEDEATKTKLLSHVVRSFLTCQNLDASLRYLKDVITASGTCPPHELITDVIKVATEADLNDVSSTASIRPKAWEAFDALKDTSISSKALLLFLEWSARQTPIDVTMAECVEDLLRTSGSVPKDAYDALVRVHASSTGDSAKAFACFDEFVHMADRDESLEASLTGMISSCVEARNSDLAEHIISWACAAGLCTLPIFSATVKVLAASKQAERICEIYESAVACKDLVLDEALTEQIASCALQAGRSELACSLNKAAKKQSMQKNPQSQLSSMRACAQDGQVEDVLALLQDFKQDGQVETVTYNCALDACVSRGDMAAADTILKEMKASNSLDVASYNIELKKCLSEGASLKVAQSVLQQMRRQGLEANTATYNSMLSCAMTSGDFDGVWQTIYDMEHSGQSADIYTLSILFKGYRRERRAMDGMNIDRALTLIKNHSVKVDESLVNVALEACLALKDVSCLKRALDTFWESGWTMPKQASLHTYGLLIKAYGQMQCLTEVWQLWTEVTQEKGMEPSEQLYGQMLDVLVGNNSLDDALNLFQDMKITHKSSLNSQGFAVAYAMIIRGFAQAKDCERALHCYEEMKAHGTKASMVVLNTLIDACSRVGDMSSAARLYQDMQDSDCAPDLITYSTLIKGHCNSDDLEQALHFFGLMQEKGIRPDAIVFNSLLDGCAKKQVPALCEQVIKDMEVAGVVPSNHSASILIKLYGRCKDLNAAFRVINEMPCKYGFRANAAVYTCLMSACIGNGQLEKAMELRVRMVNEGIYPDERTYSTLLRGALRASSVDQCLVLVNAALDQKGARARQLLEEDLLRSVLTLTQRQDAWETHGLDLQSRLRNVGINVRCALPPDSCSRNDGYGHQRNYNRNDNMKPPFGGYRDQAGKETRYSQQQQHQQQRRY